MGDPENGGEACSGRDEYYRQAAAEYGAALERLSYAYEADADRRRAALADRSGGRCGELRQPQLLTKFDFFRNRVRLWQKATIRRMPLTAFFENRDVGTWE